MVEEEWTQAVSETPTQTVTPSITVTTNRTPTHTASPTLGVVTDCVYPPEYWEEHPELWLEMVIGNTMYSSNYVRQIFSDPSLEEQQILLKHLYIANLNVYSGSDPAAIKDVLNQANQWLQEFTSGKQPQYADKLIAVQLAQALIDYNAGLIGPGFCSPYEKLTVTPLVVEMPATSTSTPTPTETATATRVFVTLKPTQIPTKTKKPDKPDTPAPPKPTDPPKPTQKPTDKPTEKPTSAPPEDTPEPPKPTDPG
jgi:hypothetical protein